MKNLKISLADERIYNKWTDPEEGHCWENMQTKNEEGRNKTKQMMRMKKNCIHHSDWKLKNNLLIFKNDKVTCHKVYVC